MKALMITDEQFEDSELFVPKEALEKAGVEVEVATREKGHPFHGRHGGTLTADLSLREVDTDNYGLLVIPGGKAPASLRHDQQAVRIAKEFFKAGKPVAAICHGPQVLVSARLLEGRHATCYKTVAQELKDNGALYEDSRVVVDGKLVTSRDPGDLPDFLREMLKQVQA